MPVGSAISGELKGEKHEVRSKTDSGHEKTMKSKSFLMAVTKKTVTVISLLALMAGVFFIGLKTGDALGDNLREKAAETVNQQDRSP